MNNILLVAHASKINFHWTLIMVLGPKYVRPVVPALSYVITRVYSYGEEGVQRTGDSIDIKFRVRVEFGTSSS